MEAGPFRITLIPWKIAYFISDENSYCASSDF